MDLLLKLKALADETRLRLAHILWKHELSVNEIVSFMEMGQSRISRHLKILSQAGIISWRRDGLWVFYKTEKEGLNSGLFQYIIENGNDEMLLQRDLERLELFLTDRTQEKTRFFDEIAIDWDRVKYDIIGEFNLVSVVKDAVLSNKVVVDLGCGTGDFLSHAAGLAKEIIGVDRSARMLEEAEKRLSNNSITANLRIGELEHLPMRDGEADTAIINMVLHHLVEPAKVLLEVGRVLKQKSALVIADLAKHSDENMRTRYGHRWLGFDDKTMYGWLKAAGFKDVSTEHYNERVSLFYAYKK